MAQSRTRRDLRGGGSPDRPGVDKEIVDQNYVAPLGNANQLFRAYAGGMLGGGDLGGPLKQLAQAPAMVSDYGGAVDAMSNVGAITPQMQAPILPSIPAPVQPKRTFGQVMGDVGMALATRGGSITNSMNNKAQMNQAYYQAQLGDIAAQRDHMLSGARDTARYQKEMDLSAAEHQNRLNQLAVAHGYRADELTLEQKLMLERSAQQAKDSLELQRQSEAAKQGLDWNAFSQSQGPLSQAIAGQALAETQAIKPILGTPEFITAKQDEYFAKLREQGLRNNTLRAQANATGSTQISDPITGQIVLVPLPEFDSNRALDIKFDPKGPTKFVSINPRDNTLIKAEPIEDSPTTSKAVFDPSAKPTAAAPMLQAPPAKPLTVGPSDLTQSAAPVPPMLQGLQAPPQLSPQALPGPEPQPIPLPTGFNSFGNFLKSGIIYSNPGVTAPESEALKLRKFNRLLTAPPYPVPSGY